MPFTAAHPAIVLPFLRVNPKYVSATGLVIGSVSPDFEYFFKMSVSSRHSHTIAGIFYFDLPVTIFLAFVFHLVMKRNLIMNLPFGLQQRFQTLLQNNFRQYFQQHIPAFIISAIAGAGSHILWDSFTHNGGYFAKSITLIKESFVPFLGTRYPMFFVLQHASTLIGLSLIVFYIIYMKSTATKMRKPSPNYWISVLVIVLITVAVRFMIRSGDLNLGNFVVTSISGMCIAVALMGFKKHEYNY